MSKRSLTDVDVDLIISSVAKRARASGGASAQELSEVFNTSTTSSSLVTNTEAEEEDQLKPRTYSEDNLIGLTDVLLVEHAIGNLRTSIKHILQNSPTESELELLKKNKEILSTPEILLALSRSKVLLASKLKSSYLSGDLPIFEDILDFEQKLKLDTKNVSIKFDTLTPSIDKTSDESEAIPKLPEIKNPAIRAQVFIHKSVIKSKLFLSEKEIIRTHNERLEFLGDSFLNTIMTQIAFNEFPDAAEGQLSILRTKLINNNLLQKWAQLYKFDQELKMEVDDSLYKGKLKIYADVFEAYIGGLIMDDPNNYSIIVDWLKRLAAPIISEFKRKNSRFSLEMHQKKPDELNNNAKVELYSLIGYAKLGLHYKTVSREDNRKTNISVFTVQVKTKDEDILGTGKGVNTKEAGIRAAMDALENKELIEKYSRLRSSIPRDETRKPAVEEKQWKGKKNKEEKTDISKPTNIPTKPIFPEPIRNSTSRGIPFDYRNGQNTGGNNQTFKSNRKTHSKTQVNHFNKNNANDSNKAIENDSNNNHQPNGYDSNRF
ncbi:hypothetical protein WICMUC_005511 [Wickerhamomyces mucosus]|uniref:ribonuclease III n=1 Tax=Wickerhamomyces mucosus TaxID=1378264 RepID=A0A9P8T5U0_9ASCO|nr:hypothetical protein WICMUC_005511 [Wickerhamomyces mucosus]